MDEIDAPETQAEVLRRGASILAERLPAGWSASLTAPDTPDRRIDGLIEVLAPNGQAATLAVVARRVVEGRDIAALRERFLRMADELPAGQGLVIARYLSRPVQARLTEAGLSYVDATGNARVEFQSPGLFVADRGADRDPWKGPGRPRGTLKGVPAAKIVRALADFTGPWKIRDLVDVSKASTGATYRVIEFLEREGLSTRDESGAIRVADWQQLLRRWSDDYGFSRNGHVTRWLAPRGLSDLVERAVADMTGRYAVTATLAAAEWAAYAPARLAMIYVTDAKSAADTLGLRRADAGANVMLAEPAIDVVFERSLTNKDGLTIAAPAQVVVDLMTGPGRNPNEAEELLEWMKRNEQFWRLKR